MACERDTEKENITTIRVNEIQHGFNGRCFAGPVSPDESGNSAGLDGKRNVLQMKRRVRFFQMTYFYDIHSILHIPLL